MYGALSSASDNSASALSHCLLAMCAWAAARSCALWFCAARAGVTARSASATRGIVTRPDCNTRGCSRAADARHRG